MENILGEELWWGKVCPRCKCDLPMVTAAVTFRYRCGNCGQHMVKPEPKENNDVRFRMPPFSCPSCETMLLIERLSQTIPADDRDCIEMVPDHVICIEEAEAIWGEVTSKSELEEHVLKLNDMVNDLKYGDQVTCDQDMKPHDQDGFCRNPRRAFEELDVPRIELRDRFIKALVSIERDMDYRLKETKIDWARVWRILEDS